MKLIGYCSEYCVPTDSLVLEDSVIDACHTAYKILLRLKRIQSLYSSFPPSYR